MQWAISRSSDEQDRRATAESRSLSGLDISMYSSTAEGMCSKLKAWSLREPRWYLDLDLGLVDQICGRSFVSVKVRSRWWSSSVISSEMSSRGFIGGGGKLDGGWWIYLVVASMCVERRMNVYFANMGRGTAPLWVIICLSSCSSGVFLIFGLEGL